MLSISIHSKIIVHALKVRKPVLNLGVILLKELISVCVIVLQIVKVRLDVVSV